MDLRDHLLTLSGYHRWAYALLLDQLSAMPEADYRGDAGLFFGSIHATLNHLLLVDKLWFGRFVGEALAITGLGQELLAARQELSEALLAQADHWIHFARTVDSDRFAGALEYRTSAGKPARTPYFSCLMHVFNHGTHHRGQISAAMTRAGFPAPEMDLHFYLLAQPSG